MKIFNNAISFIIIGVILMIIIPLPSFILDMMFILNITLSVLILLTTMYITEPLQFSVFPSVLLITTLLRLSLNVSSTRLILTNGGSAGEVIATFGEFVLQGNPVVGFIIFFIIVLVQFIVITKGAERVAEVSARFTLDAMPGKQMAIDADLNSGIINEAEALKRREKIQREADFYGAMDGATKFVKGDSIMSIIITFINFIGGIIIGMVQGGMVFEQVLTTYSISTVGDGLVSQIPSLLISTATSMIVTRAASDGSLNKDLISQVKSQPLALMIAGIVLIFMGMIPGFPKIQTYVLVVVLLIAGNRLLKVSSVKEEVALTEQEQQAPPPPNETDYYRNIDNVYDLIQVEPIKMEIGYGLIPLIDESGGSNFVDRLVMYRRKFAVEMGMVVPSISLKDNGGLNPNEYVIKLKEEEIARGEVLVNYYLALDPGNLTGEIDGIETVEPAYGIPSKWITKDKKELAEIYGYTVIDPLSVLVTHLSEVIRIHAYELLTRQDVTQLLENAKKTDEHIVEEVVPNIVNHGTLQKILSNLLREDIPIRDMETILETISSYAPTVKDTDMLTEYIRQALKRTITRKWSVNGQIKVLTLDPDLEKMIIASINKNEHGSYMSIDPDTMQRIIDSLSKEIDRMRGNWGMPIVLTTPFLRIYLKKLVDQIRTGVAVLSFNEIDSSVQIQAVGKIS